MKKNKNRKKSKIEKTIWVELEVDYHWCKEYSTSNKDTL